MRIPMLYTIRKWLALPSAVRKCLRVEGQISERECLKLYSLAQNVRRGCIVEVGSYRGRSTVILAAGSAQGSKCPVFAIEPHEPFTGALGGQYGPCDRKAFFANVLKTGTWKLIHLVNLSSPVVCVGWTQPVELLWLDGDHSYEGVKRDFNCWKDHLLPGGRIAFHDAVNPELGPARLIAELLDNTALQRVDQVDNIVVLEKPSAP